MFYPSLEEFIRLSRKGNIIPVYKEISADLDTPVSAYLKIKKGKYSFLLESVEGQEKIARYSFLGSGASLVFESKGADITVRDLRRGRARRFRAAESPLDELQKLTQSFRPVALKGLPRFYGGFVGYLGYDVVRFFEKLPEKNDDDLGVADSVFILTDTILIFDHVNHSIKIVSNVILPNAGKGLSLGGLRKIYANAVGSIESIHESLKRPLPRKGRFGEAGKRRAAPVTSNVKKPEFEDMVRRAKAYIRKGDIIQVVPSQRFKVPLCREPFDVYRSLRSLNPSPYMFFLKLDAVSLAGASPEMLVRCEDGLVETRPIAGTRPRGKTEAEDKKLERELLKSRKERAEHIMLVDLGRNDLGRVCVSGKVEVGEFMSVERYSHVMHLVSDVSGRLRKGLNSFDVLRASFPAGTVSGSPKIRAMEIIEELENTRRGPYAGCVGYFSFSRNMDTCITIRTVLMKGAAAYIQAGAGIVADSIPEKEYFETINKAKALIEAVQS